MLCMPLISLCFSKVRFAHQPFSEASTLMVRYSIMVEWSVMGVFQQIVGYGVAPGQRGPPRCCGRARGRPPFPRTPVLVASSCKMRSRVQVFDLQFNLGFN